MKTKIRVAVAATALLIGFSASADIDFASLDTSSLPVVSGDQVPKFGTFWIEIATGIAAPLPCPPGDYPDAPIYALPNGQFLVDVRNSQRVDPPAMLMFAGSSGSGGGDGPTPLDVYSNTWFTQIAIANHTYVSLGAGVLDGLTGKIRNMQLPFGIMFPVTSTNLNAPLAQWQPAGQTNPIGNFTFELPYDSAIPAQFYRLCAQLDTNQDFDMLPPYSLVLTNFKVLKDFEVSLTWTNSQPGVADERDAIIEMDTKAHSYLIDSVVTTGAVGALSFRLKSTNGLTFIRQFTNAATAGDQFFPTTNYFNNPDVVTIPYVLDTSSGRTIIEVATYDVTDPNNVQFLAHITGASVEKGTVEIPGVSLWPGVDTIEFRATDSGRGQTTTQVVITNNRPVSIVSPILELAPNGTNRIAKSSGGYKVALELVTTATNGTWVVVTYNPNGTIAGTLTASVASVGQHIIYDDGGTESTVYPVPYYDIEVRVDPPTPQGGQTPGQSDPPPPVQTKTIRVYLLPPRSNAGSITGYDRAVLPSNSGDRQFVLDVLANGESQMFAFIYHIIDFGDGIWKTTGNPTAISLNQNWGWSALRGACQAPIIS